MSNPVCGTDGWPGTGCGVNLRWERSPGWTDDPNVAIRCLDCGAVLCRRCAKAHFDSDERKYTALGWLKRTILPADDPCEYEWNLTPDGERALRLSALAR